MRSIPVVVSGIVVLALLSMARGAVASFEVPKQTACQPGQVLEVARGRDYTLDICGIGVVALRGVEPPLRVIEDGWRIGDPPGRRYAYVFSPDKTHVNAELIKRGFGYADRQGSHPRRDEFFALESAARRGKLGVWGS